MLLSYLVGVICVGFISGQQDGPLVETTYGTVRGASQQDYNNRTYDVFLGIPFAQPPVDDLRWRVPQPIEPWEDVFEATTWGDHCISLMGPVYPLIGQSGNASEDCLYLNVYLPRNISYTLASTLPVMVYYFGGGFQVGTAQSYPGEILANTGDVIVVTVNYRVSTFGFFSTGDEVCPGNYGLWDGKAGLQWVNDNIAAFGGDVTRITIFGQSAGGGLVSQFMLSNQTTNMFHRAIAISGSSLVSNSTNSTALYMSEVFNCSTTDTQEIVDCLREIPGKRLDREIKKASRRDGVLLEYGLFEDNQAPDTFIDQGSRESWKQGRGGHLDFITGTTFHDSSGFVLSTTFGIPKQNETNGYNKNNQQLFTYLLASYARYDNTQEILDALYDQFPEMNSTDDEVASQMVSRVMTDVQFGAPAFYQTEKHVQSGGAGSTYSYVFSHANNFQTGRQSWCNGSHLDDLYEILGQSFMQQLRENQMGEFGSDELALMDHIMKYYANFAHTGNPNTGPHPVPLPWPEYDLTNREFLLETPTPAVDIHTQEIQDHYNWILYDFMGLLRPEWGVPLAYNGLQAAQTIQDEDDDWYDDEYYLSM